MKVTREVGFDDLKVVGTMSKDPARNWLWVLVGNSVRLLDLDTMNAMPAYKTSDEATNIAHNALDNSTVIALRGGVFHRYHTTDEAELIEVDHWVNEGQRVYWTTFDSQTGDLLTVGASGDVLTWKPRPLLQTEFDAQSASPTTEGIRSFQIIPSTPGQWPALVGDHNGTLFRLETRNSSRTDLRFDRDAFRKFAVIDEHRLVLANEESGQNIFDQRSNAFTKLPIPFSNGNFFVLADQWLADTDLSSNRIRLVDLNDSKNIITLPAYNPTCACIAPRNQRVFWNNNNSVMVRSLNENSEEKLLETFSRNPWHLRVSPDESLLAIGLSDREIYLWDWRANKRVGPVMMHEGQVYAVAFSPGGRTLLTVDDSATLRFWNITTGQQVSQTNLGITPGNSINTAKFTLDGNFVVVLHDGDNITTFRIR
ncbi:MAG TPA: hypothetical protein DDZ51_01595 [Planctomycetaceae bacterium]|nr:hypothetical protein [Planctomycetaceae bacterium]